MRSLCVQEVGGQRSAEAFIDGVESVLNLHSAEIQESFVFTHCLGSRGAKDLKSVCTSPQACLRSVARDKNLQPPDIRNAPSVHPILAPLPLPLPPAFPTSCPERLSSSQSWQKWTRLDGERMQPRLLPSVSQGKAVEG